MRLANGAGNRLTHSGPERLDPILKAVRGGRDVNPWMETSGKTVKKTPALWYAETGRRSRWDGQRRVASSLAAKIRTHSTAFSVVQQPHHSGMSRIISGYWGCVNPGQKTQPKKLQCENKSPCKWPTKKSNDNQPCTASQKAQSNINAISADVVHEIRLGSFHVIIF